MFELLVQILILVGVFFLVRWILLSIIPRAYLTWLGGVVIVIILLWALLDPTNRTLGIAWAILSAVFSPLGLSLIFLASALKGGVKKADGVLVAWALGILLISSLPLTAYLLTARTEQQAVVNAINRREDPADLAAVEAIVVLGNDTLPTDPTYRIRTEISNTDTGFTTNLLSRLAYAAQLYNQLGTNPLVIVSAGPQPEFLREDVPAAQGITDYLVSLGVPSGQVLIDSEGVDARTSAVAVARLLGTGDEGGTLMLVAPVITIRRATLAFANFGFEVILRPTDFYVFQLQQTPGLAVLSDLIPSAEALIITSRAWSEFLAYLYYLLRGWLVDPLVAWVPELPQLPDMPVAIAPSIPDSN